MFKSVEGTEGLHVACYGCTRVYDARGPLTKTSSRVLARHTASFFVGQDTLVMTLCCDSHPLGPTVDRHSLVNSGARYAEDYVVTVFGLHLGGRRPTCRVRDSSRPRSPRETHAGDVNAVHLVAPRG